MVIARDGQAAGVIGIAADADEVVRFAARELQTYLGKVTGAVVSVCTEPRGDVIITIRRDSSLAEDELSIQSDESVLDLAGGPRSGVLYAVYAFLREACGIVFAGHTVEGEQVPRLAALEIGRLSIRRKPFLWYRGSQLTVWGEIHGREVDSWREMALKRIDWMAKNGMNFILYQPWETTDEIELQHYEWTSETTFKHRVTTVPHWYTNQWFRENLLPEIRKRGMKVEQSHHNFRLYLPPSRYFAPHPEYYALVNGKRDPGLSQLMICTSNTEAVDELVRNMLVFLEQNPEVDVIGLMPEDGLGVCECEECRKLDEPRFALRKDGYRYFFGQDQNKTRRYIRVVNSAARAVARRFPGKLVSALFYTDMAWPPAEMELAENVMPMVCMYVRCGAHAYDDPRCPINRDFFDMIRSWSTSGNHHVVLYEYYMGISYLRSMPHPIAHRIAEDWKLLGPLGMGGATMQYSVTANETHVLNGFTFARRCWDLVTPFETILDEFLLGMFGSAGPLMKPVYARLMARYREEGEAGRCIRPYPKTFFRVVTAADGEYMAVVVDAILEGELGARERTQVLRFRRSLEHIERFRAIDERMDRWEASDREKAFPGVFGEAVDALPRCDRTTYGMIMELLELERTHKDAGYFALGNDLSQWKNAVRRPRAE